MNDLNSAAHVSTFLYTGITLSADLFLLTISSDVFDNSDNFLSENPIDFILLIEILHRLVPHSVPFVLILARL